MKYPSALPLLCFLCPCTLVGSWAYLLPTCILVPTTLDLYEPSCRKLLLKCSVCVPRVYVSSENSGTSELTKEAHKEACIVECTQIQ